MFFPDGPYLAYTSDESGQSEVYVIFFPGRGGKQLISRQGGFWPVWSPAGRQLFYRSGNQLMRVQVIGDGKFGTPEPLFQAAMVGGLMPMRS